MKRFFRDTVLMVSLLIIASIAFLALPEPSIGAVDDSTIGKPATITGTVAVTTVSTVGAVTSVTNVAAGQIQTDAMASGIVGSTTLAVTTSTAVSVGVLTAGTKQIRIITTDDVNLGNSGVFTGAGCETLSATASPYLFNVSTTTPILYFIGKAGAASVLINHLK